MVNRKLLVLRNKNVHDATKRRKINHLLSSTRQQTKGNPILDLKSHRGIKQKHGSAANRNPVCEFKFARTHTASSIKPFQLNQTTS